MQAPDAGVLLHLWSSLDSPKAVRKWVATEIQDVGKFPRFLSRLISKSTSTSHRETKVHYFIDRKSLESYCTLDAEFENCLQKIDREKLPHWEKFAIEEALKRIDEKKRGIVEAEYDA